MTPANNCACHAGKCISRPPKVSSVLTGKRACIWQYFVADLQHALASGVECAIVS